jgi:hypothetical protein
MYGSLDWPWMTGMTGATWKPNDWDDQKARMTCKLEWTESQNDLKLEWPESAGITWMTVTIGRPKCLLHRYICGTFPVAPIKQRKANTKPQQQVFAVNLIFVYRCVTICSDMFATHCLFGRTWPVNSAVESGNRNKFIKLAVRLQNKRIYITPWL